MPVDGLRGRDRQDLLQLAWEMALTERNFFNSACRRFSPMPGISSSPEAFMRRERSVRWYVMAKRCVSSWMVPMRANTDGTALMAISSPAAVTSALVRWRSSLTMP